MSSGNGTTASLNLCRYAVHAVRRCTVLRYLCHFDDFIGLTEPKLKSIHIHVTAAVPWSNWARTVKATPQRIIDETSRDAIAEAVAAHYDRGAKIKAVGAGHSFTGIASCDDAQLRVTRYRREPIVDTQRSRITVPAGIPLHELNLLLASHGLAMPNLGDIDAQTLAGAVSTGTHGTGAQLPGLAAAIRGITMIDGTGTVRDYTANSPELSAVAVGLGALGIITDITLQCVPSFQLHADERPLPLGKVTDEFAALADANDHFEFYWFPGTDLALVKRNNRTETGKPLSRLRSWIDDELLSNTVYGLLCRLGTAVPATVPAITAIAARAQGARNFTDASYRVFCTPRRVRFVEMEYALPLAAFHEAFAALRAIANRHRVIFPVEVRVAAPDDIWMSTAYGRDTVYFAVHQYRSMPYREYFDDAETVMRAHGGRPHWGKLHGRAAADLERAYPRFTEFTALRDQLDPGRIFANAYLERVLGQ